MTLGRLTALSISRSPSAPAMLSRCRFSSDAYVLAAPDGQWGTPVARAAQVPVHQVFEPVAEAAGAGAFGLPVDGFVELDQPVLHGRGLDKPGVERVVQHGLVGAPAVRVGVLVLLHFEGRAVLFQLDGDAVTSVGLVVGIGLVVAVVVLHLRPPNSPICCT